MAVIKEEGAKEEKERRVFMKPGKDNREDRMNFVKYWAEYVRTHSDKEWSRQQNIVIDSQYPKLKD
ncbi:hypothetical protein J4447_01240 [Candidatus Pacearchaeota archaeon]|nr:hypothetical protein [Candidatus Pacearchaeota archaeon]